jgi:rhomboid family GlyGly-CTERM serine protease
VAAQALLSSARLPVRTLAICAAALLVHFVPGLVPLLIYDRAAIAHGELWRLLTGNLVHLSDAHLTLDLAAFLIAGAIVEQRGYRHFATLCVSAAVLIGVAIYLFEPGLQFYGGLSGVVTAAIVYLCLQGITEQGSWRWLCAAMLAGLSTKLWIELVLGKSLLLAFGTGNFVPVPLSHLTGAVAAVILFALLRSPASMVVRDAARNVTA